MAANELPNNERALNADDVLLVVNNNEKDKVEGM